MNYLEDTETIKESELLSADQANKSTLYVTASVNYDNLHSNFTIGDGSNFTDPISQRIFHNVPLQKQQKYYYFIRVYSKAHTIEVSQEVINLSVLLF